jgi:hypothetical protein
MLEHIIEIVFGVGAAILMWDVFISDSLSDRWKSFRKRKSDISDSDKIARVKLTSDSAKDIEKFITDNAHNLSDEMVQKLVERIEFLHADKAIFEDNLKTRIDAIPNMVAAQEEAPKKAKR